MATDPLSPPPPLPGAVPIFSVVPGPAGEPSTVIHVQDGSLNPITNADVRIRTPGGLGVGQQPEVELPLTDAFGNTTALVGNGGRSTVTVTAPGYQPFRAEGVGWYIPSGEALPIYTVIMVPITAQALSADFCLLISASDSTTLARIPGVIAWATSDEAGDTLVAGPVVTQGSGCATLLLAKSTTYWLWFSSASYDVGAGTPVSYTTTDQNTATYTLSVARLNAVPNKGAGGASSLAVSTGASLARGYGWLTSDAAGANRVTNERAIPTSTGGPFTGLADGTYYLWVYGIGYSTVRALPVTVSGATSVSVVLYRTNDSDEWLTATPYIFRPGVGGVVYTVRNNPDLNPTPIEVGPFVSTAGGIAVCLLRPGAYQYTTSGPPVPGVCPAGPINFTQP